MTDFSQPNANQYALQGYKFFRLNTLISSPGDIFESEQSGHAFAIGPDSDVANVAVAYFDQSASGFMSQTILTPQRSWVGRLDARNDATYAPAGRPGRLLFWLADTYLPNFFPFNYDQVNDSIIRVTPRLDVIEYFEPQSSLVPQRNDGLFQFQNLAPLSVTGASWLTVPYWGRRYGSVTLGNAGTTDDYTYAIYGVNYSTNWSQQIYTGTVAADTTVNKIIKATVDGMFDALFIRLADAGGGIPPTAVPIIVRTSDTLA
jgi:hypothetical protein